MKKAHRTGEKGKFEQLGLFPDIVCSAYLVAGDSPKSAFYRIWIEVNAGLYTVIKESGIKDRVLNKRAWPQASLEEARKLFDRRIKEKTNSERKSPRKYQLIDHSESMVVKPSHGKLADVVQNANRRSRSCRRPKGQRQITESSGYVQQYITF